MRRFGRWLRSWWVDLTVPYPYPDPRACSLQFPAEPVKVAPADAPLEAPAALLDGPVHRAWDTTCESEATRRVRGERDVQADLLPPPHVPGPIHWLAPGTSIRIRGADCSVQDMAGMVWAWKEPDELHWRAPETRED